MIIYAADYPVGIIHVYQAGGYHVVDHYAGVADFIAVAEKGVDVGMEIVNGHGGLSYPGKDFGMELGHGNLINDE